MRLRTALNTYKRARSDHERFPEETKTVEGALSGHGDRLVHVGPNGALRDHSTPLSGLSGIDRSRLGVRTPDGVTWFDDLDAVRQHYYRETTLVETEYDAGTYTIHQYDLTLGRAHCTHVELRGSVPEEASLTAFLTLAPDSRESSVGRLIHERGGPDGSTALEVFHREEHDYVTASTGLSDVRGQVPERFEELLDDAAFEFPRQAAIRRYEDTHLSGDVVVSAPLERAGRGVRTTLVTQLSDHDDVGREEALVDLRNCATTHQSAEALREAARARADVAVAETVPRSEQVRADLRALDLLTAPAGAHVAGPEFDTFYANSGGYGYVWFRDDARITGHLMDADERFDIGVDDNAPDVVHLTVGDPVLIAVGPRRNDHVAREAAQIRVRLLLDRRPRHTERDDGDDADDDTERRKPRPDPVAAEVLPGDLHAREPPERSKPGHDCILPSTNSTTRSVYSSSCSSCVTATIATSSSSFSRVSSSRMVLLVS